MRSQPRPQGETTDMDGIHKESTCVFNPFQAHQLGRIPVETQEMKLFSEMPPTEL